MVDNVGQMVALAIAQTQPELLPLYTEMAPYLEKKATNKALETTQYFSDWVKSFGANKSSQAKAIK